MVLKRKQSKTRELIVVAFGGGLFVSSSSAVGLVLVDDFTMTQAPTPFPLSLDAAFPTIPAQAQDAFGPIFGQPGGRVLSYAPLLTAEQALSGVFSGNQTIDLDTSAGRLTSTSTGDGSPLLLLAWTSSDLSTNGLNLDISGEDGLLIEYTTNLPVNMELTLVQDDNPAAGTFKAGNIARIVLQPGQRSTFVPFVDFDEELTRLDFSTFPATTVILDPIDLTEVDGLLTLINPIEDTTVPEGLIVSFDRVAFVSEPVPGDADLDGDIDDTDLGIAISNFTGPVGAAGGKTASQGDADADGDVDDTDLGVAISGFTGPLVPATVPEPASFATFALGSAALARRRRTTSFKEAVPTDR